jgi:hypothetical protein
MAQMDIEQRNTLRAEAGLPLLDVHAEVLRLQAARGQAEFEKYFQTQRHRFAHLWEDRSRGFWTKMGIWNAVRKKLRDEMQNRRD